MKNALWLLQAIFLYAVTFPIALLPLHMVLRVGALIGQAGYLIWGSRRRIAIENINQAIRAGFIFDSKPPDDIIKENFRNLGRSIAEIIKIYHGFGREILDRVEIKGFEHYQKARERGRGVLLISGHCGNWEVLALAASYKVSPITVVARPINNPYLNRLVEKTRKRYGNSVIYKQGALRAIISLFREGRAVGILIDQSVLPDEGVIVEFLGRPAWTMKVPALIARKTGVAVVPVFIKRTGIGHLIEIYPEVELSGVEDFEKAVLEDTARFTSYIERYIRENPAEWLWIHRRWKRT